MDQMILVHWLIGPLGHWSIVPLVYWSIGPLLHWSIDPLSNVKCQNSIRLNFCRSVPPKFLWSFFQRISRNFMYILLYWKTIILFDSGNLKLNQHHQAFSYFWVLSIIIISVGSEVAGYPKRTSQLQFSQKEAPTPIRSSKPLGMRITIDQLSSSNTNAYNPMPRRSATLTIISVPLGYPERTSQLQFRLKEAPTLSVRSTKPLSRRITIRRLSSSNTNANAYNPMQRLFAEEHKQCSDAGCPKELKLIFNHVSADLKFWLWGFICVSQKALSTRRAGKANSALAS